MDDRLSGLLGGGINFVIFIWFGLAVSAILITLLECYKKTFFDDVAYRIYCRFWRKFMLRWYVVSSTSLGFINADFFGDAGRLLWSFLGFLPNYLLPFSIPTLLVLAVSLLPAKLQNCYSKSK